MKIDELVKVNENELPLENIKYDGGYISIFRNIACIGDSLSSGEFEYVKGDIHEWHDKYEYSWGQYIARMAGVKVYNFSRGGMSCKEYINTFANEINAYDEAKKCEAYIIALGVNDLFNDGCKLELGDIDDLENNKDTMSNYYQQIILKYKKIAPNAKFFFVSMPNEGEEETPSNKKLAHRELLYKFAEKYSNSYVIDLYKYAPTYDQDFKEKFFFHGHMNACGYKLTGLMIASYIDYIIRHNFKAFTQAGFINTDRYDADLD